MIRRLVLLATLAVLAGCASREAPRPAPQPSIPSAPPRGEPGQYLNMSASALQAAFGKPSFVRKDGTIEMWRYDGAGCRAFFFLYGEQGRQAVRHVETLPHGAGIAADMGCLTALRASPPPVS